MQDCPLNQAFLNGEIDIPKDTDVPLQFEYTIFSMNNRHKMNLRPNKSSYLEMDNAGVYLFSTSTESQIHTHVTKYRTIFHQL